jgi:transglutaminase-like putative cysteine protease
LPDVSLSPADTQGGEASASKTPPTTENVTYTPTQPSAAVEINVEEVVADDSDSGEMTAEDIRERERIGLNDESVRRMLTEMRGYYHFDRLTDSERLLYVELYQIMTEYASAIVVSSKSPPIIEKVFQCVLNDHPQIFYIVGYRYTRYSLEGETKKINFTASYSVGVEEVKRRQSQIDAYVETCRARMPVGAGIDDYEKVKYVYEYVINNTEYDLSAPDNQNICSVFLGGRSVCQGYAKATQYLLNKFDIPATLVMGKVASGESHAWNLIVVDGEYYYVDSTFGDASYQGDATAAPSSSWNSRGVWPINYDYLNVTTAQINVSHKAEPIVPLVECVATVNNYYVREGLLFDFVDENKLQEIFNREYERGSQYLTLKCANSTVFAEMMMFLIEQQNVFSYLQSADGVVRYVDSQEQLSISFWL